MDIKYHISHLLDEYDNGLTSKVHEFAYDFERYKQNRKLANNDQGYLKSIDELLKDMKGYEKKPKIYKHMATLLSYYAKEIENEANNLGIKLT